MIYSGKKNYWVPFYFITIIVLILILIVFISPSLTIKTFCHVYPKEEWTLIRGNNGEIISCTVDYEKGHTIQYSLNQFERGEFVSLKISNELNHKDFINRGDTIASIISSEVEDKLITVEGELDVAIANLKAQSTGQKESMIREAENKLKYTEEKIKEQNVLYQRISALYEKDFSSRQEYDAQKWIIDLLQLEKQIYKAEVENVSTGVKGEEINLIESQINSIKKNLGFLKNRKNSLTIISPISGYMTNILSADTLIDIINDQEIVLNMPVKIEDLEFIKKGQSIKINISDFEKEYSGVILSISHKVEFLNSQQVIFVLVNVVNNDGKILPGMIKESYLQIKKITFYEYIQRLLTT